MFYIQPRPPHLEPYYTETDNLQTCCRFANNFLHVQFGLVGHGAVADKQTSREITVYLNSILIKASTGFSDFCNWVVHNRNYKTSVGRANSFLRKVVVICNNEEQISLTQFYFVLDQQAPVRLIYLNDGRNRVTRNENFVTQWEQEGF